MRLTPDVGPQDHVRGPADAPHTLVEFGDYQCPYCRRAAPAVQAVLARLGDQVRFVFRNYPLPDMHPHALPAARLAEAAAAAGRFWEMHDLLYARQDALGREHLLRYAEALGVGRDAFARAEEGAFDARIEADMRSGDASGIQGTPTFYLDGRRLPEGQDAESLIAAIEAA